MRWGEISETGTGRRPLAKPTSGCIRCRCQIGAARPARYQAERRQARRFVFTTNWRFQRRVQKLSGIEDFFPHAIRHTVETKLGAVEGAAALARPLARPRLVARIGQGLRSLGLSGRDGRGDGAVGRLRRGFSNARGGEGAAIMAMKKPLLLVSGLVLVCSPTPSLAATVACKPHTIQRGTVRCSDGMVWRKDRYGFETWRSNTGRVCKTDRYGETVRCTSP